MVIWFRPAAGAESGPAASADAFEWPGTDRPSSTRFS
jgi:hypothetical protein